MRGGPGYVSATVQDLPAAHGQEFSYEVEASGLAGAVGADERMDRSATNVEVNFIDSREPSKRLG
jgi:hypothetical protein